MTRQVTTFPLGSVASRRTGADSGPANSSSRETASCFHALGCLSGQGWEDVRRVRPAETVDVPSHRTNWCRVSAPPGKMPERVDSRHSQRKVRISAFGPCRGIAELNGGTQPDELSWLASHHSVSHIRTQARCPLTDGETQSAERNRERPIEVRCVGRPCETIEPRNHSRFRSCWILPSFAVEGMRHTTPVSMYFSRETRTTMQALRAHSTAPEEPPRLAGR